MESELGLALHVEEYTLTEEHLSGDNEIEAVVDNGRVEAFHEYVAQNADILVESARMPGVELALGALMGMCGARVTIQNVDRFWAEVDALLFAARAKSSLGVEEEQTENNEETEIETAGGKSNIDTKQEARVKQSKKNNTENKKDKPAESKQISQASEQPQTLETTIAGVRSEQGINDKNGITINSIGETRGEVTVGISDKSIVHKNEKSVEAAPKSESQPQDSFVPAEAPAAGSDLVEPKITAPVSSAKLPVLEQSSAETVGLTLSIEDEPRIDKLYLEPESDTTTRMDSPKTDSEAVEDDIELEPQLQVDGEHQPLVEPVELELHEERAGEDFITSGQESLSFDMPENTQDSLETVIELSIPAEKIEQIILRIAENIEQMEVEETEIAHQILDEIVEKITEAQSLEAPNLQNMEVAVETACTEEELKELFIQLFDYVEVEYSPELIESLVKLALRGKISDLLAKIEQENENTNSSHESGTHEVIKQLLAAISSVKRTVQYAYQIGKSALQLYSQELLSIDLMRRPAYEAVIY